eukprot:TRINITY_DN12829_c0_g1_i1.p1 TRINITY_DN12829_c0_g1~~TRINITY_DN12829_c0_g1_i1.p1  ORF type:complete len:614 (+),score=163.48 TRINITY_DN12829_c0_g1_i1:57-1898(+)
MHARSKRLLVAYHRAVCKARLRSGKRFYYNGQQYPYQHRQGPPPPPPPPPGYQQYQYPYAQYPPQHPHSPPPQGRGSEANEKGSWPNPVVMQVTRSDMQILMDWMRNLVILILLGQIFTIEIIPSPKGSSDSTTDGGKDQVKAEGGGSFASIFGLAKRDAVVPVDLNQVAHSVKWDDILGCDEAKADLVEVTKFLKDPDKFTKLGGKLPKGYLLVGPPGTGKTMLAKAIAKEADVPFFYTSGAQFEEVFVGVGSKRVRELFKAAREKKPCIIFIDEIDAVGTKRSKLDASHDRATINQLLSEMDGFNSSDSIIVIAATNSPKTLDKALTRPGRLDRMVSVDPPDLKGRVQILEHYLKKVKAGNIDVKQIARGTTGMTGADLSNIVNIATLSAAKMGLDDVTSGCLEEAKDRVSMGMEHRSRKIPEHERKNTAYHEAGHALVAMFTDKAASLHKATIIPRGQALGLTVQLPPDDQISTSLAQMNARLRVLMGGRIAEQVVFGEKEVTSGASNDLEQATMLARAMVRKYGLSSSMGCVDYSFADDPNGVFLSNDTKNKIEREVKTLIDKAHQDALATIETNRSVLNAIAEGLLENDTLTGAEMRKMANLPEPEEH